MHVCAALMFRGPLSKYARSHLLGQAKHAPAAECPSPSPSPSLSPEQEARASFQTLALASLLPPSPPQHPGQSWLLRPQEEGSLTGPQPRLKPTGLPSSVTWGKPLRHAERWPCLPWRHTWATPGSPRPVGDMTPAHGRAS